MTTRLEIRQAVRRRLRDTGIDSLWDDPFLNDAIDEGLRRYSTRFPRQAATVIAVTVGDRELTIPPTVNAMQVIRLFDDTGEPWRSWASAMGFAPTPVGQSGHARVWRAWAGALCLDSPAPRTGFWRVEHEANRVLPINDTVALDMNPGDDDVVIAIAMAIALNRRAINDGKRYTGKSGVHPLAAASRIAQSDADRLIGNRLRHIRSSP